MDGQYGNLTRDVSRFFERTKRVEKHLYAWGASYSDNRRDTRVLLQAGLIEKFLRPTIGRSDILTNECGPQKNVKLSS